MVRKISKLEIKWETTEKDKMFIVTNPEYIV